VPAAHARSKRSRNTHLPTPDDGTPDVDPLGLQTCLRNRGVPFEVLNDGDVTALAASMSLEKNAIIGKKRRAFLRCHLYIKVIFLPRQARDKHRESTQKELPCLSK